MKKDLLIGIDVGSSNIKSVLFDRQFNVLANESDSIDIHLPKPGWTEYDPNDWWEHVRSTVKRCLLKANADPQRIAGIGVSSLGCCVVPLDKEGNCVYNAIPWSDQRAFKEVEFLEKNCKDLIFKKSGNIPTGLSATPHLLWLKNKVPEVYEKIYQYTEASGFIVQRLTGEFALDYSIASGLDYGIDVKNLDYSEELIQAMGLDIQKYARLHKNTEIVGNITKKAAHETGLQEGTPVFLGGLDIITAALAGGAIYPGQGFYSMGSASNMMIITDQDVPSPYLMTIKHVISTDINCVFGSQGAVGFSFKWFAEQFGDIEKIASELFAKNISNFELMSMEASKAAPGSGGLIYLPYLFGKFHPVFDPHCRGVFFGLSPTSTKADFIRSLIEGATFNMYETINSASEAGLTLKEIIASGGPTNSEIWCQVIADITGKKIITIDAPEASALGDAMLAGVGVGLFKDFKTAVDDFIKPKKEYSPDLENHQLYEALFKIYRQVYDSLKGSFIEMAEIKEKFDL